MVILNILNNYLTRVYNKIRESVNAVGVKQRSHNNFKDVIFCPSRLDGICLCK